MITKTKACELLVAIEDDMTNTEWATQNSGKDVDSGFAAVADAVRSVQEYVELMDVDEAVINKQASDLLSGVPCDGAGIISHWDDEAVSLIKKLLAPKVSDTKHLRTLIADNNHRIELLDELWLRAADIARKDNDQAVSDAIEMCQEKLITLYTPISIVGGE